MVPNRRIFLFTVKSTVFYSQPTENTRMVSIQVAPNVYFYMSKSYRIPATKDATIKFAQRVAREITNLVNQALKRLQKFWYNNVNKYFNRRASMFHPPNRRKVHGYYNTSRQHTGQLRRCLKIVSSSPNGGKLFAAPTYARTDGSDYVEILMRGAKPGPRAYDPLMDFRLNPNHKNNRGSKAGRWGGIPKTYWSRWQQKFEEEIRKEEAKINDRIEDLVQELQIMHKRDLRSLTSKAQRDKMYVSSDEEFQKLTGEEYKKSFYVKASAKLAPVNTHDQSQGVNINNGSWERTVLRNNRGQSFRGGNGRSI